jgi:hypothetical protein
MKLCLITAGLCLTALVIGTSGLFGEANAIGVAMFLGLFIGVPAILFVVLSLLSLAARSAGTVKVSSNLYVRAGQLSGTCPNCVATIPVDSVECPNCQAIFGENSVWRVQSSTKE